MTTDPQPPDADPADFAEQQRDVVPPVDDEEVLARGPAELPLEANEADVAEQRAEARGWDEDVDGP